jgi:hypothetical protein
MNNFAAGPEGGPPRRLNPAFGILIRSSDSDSWPHPEAEPARPSVTLPRGGVYARSCRRTEEAKRSAAPTLRAARVDESTRQLTLPSLVPFMHNTRRAVDVCSSLVHVELVGPAVDAEALIFLVFGVTPSLPPVFLEDGEPVLAFFHELSCNAFTISKSLRRNSTIVGIVHVPNLPITVSVNQKLLDS